MKVSDGTSYWTAVLQPRGTDGVIRFRDKGSSGATSYGSSSSSLSSLPASYRHGSKGPGAPVSIYADGAAAPVDQSAPLLALPLPPLDSDGDGIPDALDQCPTQAGPAPSGCPPAARPLRPPAAAAG